MRYFAILFLFIFFSCEKEVVKTNEIINDDLVTTRSCHASGTETNLIFESFDVVYNSTCDATATATWTGYHPGDKDYITAVRVNTIASTSLGANCGPSGGFCIIGKSWTQQFNGDITADSYSFNGANTAITIEWTIDNQDFIEAAFGGINSGSCNECGVDKDYTSLLTINAEVDHVNGACSWTSTDSAHRGTWEGEGVSSDWDAANDGDCTNTFTTDGIVFNEGNGGSACVVDDFSVSLSGTDFTAASQITNWSVKLKYGSKESGSSWYYSTSVITSGTLTVPSSGYVSIDITPSAINANWSNESFGSAWSSYCHDSSTDSQYQTSVELVEIKLYGSCPNGCSEWQTYNTSTVLVEGTNYY